MQKCWQKNKNYLERGGGGGGHHCKDVYNDKVVIMHRSVKFLKFYFHLSFISASTHSQSFCTFWVMCRLFPFVIDMTMDPDQVPISYFMQTPKSKSSTKWDKLG